MNSQRLHLAGNYRSLRFLCHYLDFLDNTVSGELVGYLVFKHKKWSRYTPLSFRQVRFVRVAYHIVGMNKGDIVRIGKKKGATPCSNLC